MTVGRICCREVDVATSDESVQVAARRMHDRKVGTLVVIDDARHPIGIVTDRDLAVRIVATGRDAAMTSIGEVMTRTPRSIGEHEPIESALSAMRVTGCRRITVVDRDGSLVGLISLDDVLALLTEEFRQIGSVLEKESPQSLANA
jgi:signal-transduction protein with cAMP-binding, CBS, and nucleotidyltransferase domain